MRGVHNYAMLNDDQTPMEFVVKVLQETFGYRLSSPFPAHPVFHIEELWLEDENR